MVVHYLPLCYNRLAPAQNVKHCLVKGVRTESVWRYNDPAEKKEREKGRGPENVWADAQTRFDRACKQRGVKHLDKRDWNVAIDWAQQVIVVDHLVPT